MFDEIFKVTHGFIVNKKEETTNSLRDFFRDNQNVITVGILKNLCKKYSEGSESDTNSHKPIRNHGIWKAWLGYNYGSKSMKKLAHLCKDKEDYVQLTGKEIFSCLSPHRTMALHDWIWKESSGCSTSKPSSGTEYVIREIYKKYIVSVEMVTLHH